MIINRKREKELTLLEDNVLKELENKRVRVSEIYKILNKKYITTNYDNIRAEIEGILEITRFVKMLTESEKCIKITEDIHEVVGNIFNKIIEVGSSYKRDILYKLDTLENSDNNEETKETLEWVWNKLELDNIGHEGYINNIYFDWGGSDLIHGKRSYTGISYRQMNALKICTNYASLKEIKKAIHALYEFIDNYQYNIREPFSSFERICVKTMILSINRGM